MKFLAEFRCISEIEYQARYFEPTKSGYTPKDIQIVRTETRNCAAYVTLLIIWKMHK